MKNVILFFSATICMVLFWSSCSKDRIEQEMNEYQSPNAYLDSKKQEEQVFVIDSAGTGPIVGSQGTTIWGTKECLRLPNGDTISYPFIVKLVELYSAKDMIYYRMPTVGSGQALESAGEIRLRAEKDGTTLTLSSPCAYKISLPNSVPQDNYMRVFYGDENVAPVNWLTDLNYLGITSLQNGFFAVDTIGYTALTEKLGWINADRAIVSSNTYTINFTSEVDDLTNVAIFVYLPETHTVMQASNLAVSGIPAGSNAKIIAIAVNGSGSLFHFYLSTTVSGNQNVEVTMSQISDANLTTLLDGL